jgi:hypothetical protein
MMIPLPASTPLPVASASTGGLSLIRLLVLGIVLRLTD